MIGQAPIINKKLLSGKHKIVVKPLYKKYETTITITDGEQKQFAPILQPNYADVTLTTDTNSEIWINGENKGKGSFTGKLEIGSYMVECKRPSHTTTKELVDITESEVKNIKLQIPQPIYGMVTISADQPDANIYLDGKNIGLTPQYLPQTLIGTHTIKMTKPGCADWVSNITISEGKLTEVNAILQTGKEVQFTSTKTDATLYIDGEYKGSANGAYTLTYGTHNIVCKSQGEKDFTTTITVAQTKDIQKVNCQFNSLDDVSNNVEKMPTYPGGQKALLQYIADNIKYPRTAQEKGIQGRVVVRFVVKKDGTVGDAQIFVGSTPELNQEAIRVVKSITGFIPGYQNGKPVNVWHTVPVSFKLM